MKKRIDAEALLHTLYRHEILVEARQRSSRMRGHGAPRGPGRVAASSGERGGLARACLAAAACLALLAWSGALLRPRYEEPRGLFIAAEALGELIEQGGLLEPFKDMPQTRTMDGGT